MIGWEAGRRRLGFPSHAEMPGISAKPLEWLDLAAGWLCRRFRRLAGIGHRCQHDDTQNDTRRAKPPQIPAQEFNVDGSPLRLRMPNSGHNLSGGFQRQSLRQAGRNGTQGCSDPARANSGTNPIPVCAPLRNTDTGSIRPGGVSRTRRLNALTSSMFEP